MEYFFFLRDKVRFISSYEASTNGKPQSDEPSSNSKMPAERPIGCGKAKKQKKEEDMLDKIEACFQKKEEDSNK